MTGNNETLERVLNLLREDPADKEAFDALKRIRARGNHDGEGYIVVLPHGFVIVCRRKLVDENTVEATHCFCLREWSQRKDLGGAAYHGREGNTLSPQPPTEWHIRNEIQRIRLPEEVWAEIFDDHPAPYGEPAPLDYEVLQGSG